jgi:transposase
MLTKLLQLFRGAGPRVRRSGAGPLSALLACALLAGPAHAADPRESGPRTLVITYHTSPANRLAFRQELEQSGVRQLQRWKDDGVLQSYRILFNRYVDSANWDAMSMVTFAKESDIERWKRIELEAPAGLSPKALSLVTSIDTVPADLMRQNGTAQSRDSSVFVVIPYEYVVPVDE